MTDTATEVTVKVDHYFCAKNGERALCGAIFKETDPIILEGEPLGEGSILCSTCRHIDHLEMTAFEGKCLRCGVYCE